MGMNLRNRSEAVAGIVILLAGGAIIGAMWIYRDTDAIVWIIFGVLIAGVGLAILRGRNREISYMFIITGLFSLFVAIGRAWIYSLTNELPLLLLLLSAVMFLRGYQYRQAGISTEA